MRPQVQNSRYVTFIHPAKAAFVRRLHVIDDHSQVNACCSEPGASADVLHLLQDSRSDAETAWGQACPLVGVSIREDTQNLDLERRYEQEKS